MPFVKEVTMLYDVPGPLRILTELVVLIWHNSFTTVPPSEVEEPPEIFVIILTKPFVNFPA